MNCSIKGEKAYLKYFKVIKNLQSIHKQGSMGLKCIYNINKKQQNIIDFVMKYDNEFNDSFNIVNYLNSIWFNFLYSLNVFKSGLPIYNINRKFIFDLLEQINGNNSIINIYLFSLLSSCVYYLLNDILYFVNKKNNLKKINITIINSYLHCYNNDILSKIKQYITLNDIKITFIYINISGYSNLQYNTSIYLGNVINYNFILSEKQYQNNYNIFFKRYFFHALDFIPGNADYILSKLIYVDNKLYNIKYQNIENNNGTIINTISNIIYSVMLLHDYILNFIGINKIKLNKVENGNVYIYLIYTFLFFIFLYFICFCLILNCINHFILQSIFDFLYNFVIDFNNEFNKNIDIM